MKKILKFAIILLLAGSFTSCGKEKENEFTSLEGTKWQMVCFVDTQTGNTIEVEPKCDRCYTLSFDTDSTASGYSVINIIGLSLKPVLWMRVITEAYDHKIGDVQLFYDTMETINSYKVEKNQLKFFYNSNKNYLLFKLIKP
jgi:hypothetical protein